MFIVGLILRALDSRFNTPGQSVVSSLAALVLLLPLINVESDFSLVFGGFVLNGVAIIVLLRWLALPEIAGVPGPVRLPRLFGEGARAGR